MKYFLASVVLLCTNILAHAQYNDYLHPDSLQNYPYLYLYNWEGVEMHQDDSVNTVLCTGQFFSTGSSVRERWYSERGSISEYAFYQHSDTTLHAIGIACGDISELCSDRKYHLGLYNSSMEPLKEMIPSATIVLQYYGMLDSGYYYFIIPGCSPRSPFCDANMILQFSLFNEPIDISGDFFISFGQAPDCSRGIPWNYFVYEIHNPPYHIGNTPVKLYNKDTKEWVDDTLEHDLPEIFLIIEPECHGAENVRVTTDSLGCVRVDWDTLRWQEQWVLRLDGPGGTRYDTVDTCFHTYCGLDLNRHYEFSIMSQCYLPGGKHNWSSWGNPVTIGAVGITETEIPKPEIVIHPNPATEQVEVTSSLPMARIVATDALGHSLLDRPATGLKTTLDVSRWPAGAYLLQVHTATGIASRKLLVQ